MLRNRRFNPDQIIIEKDIEFGYHCIIIDDEFEELKKENEQLKQNANKIAIEKLEELKTLIKENSLEYNGLDEPNFSRNKQYIRSCTPCEKINSMIAKLKGELI